MFYYQFSVPAIDLAFCFPEDHSYYESIRCMEENSLYPVMTECSSTPPAQDWVSKMTNEELKMKLLSLGEKPEPINKATWFVPFEWSLFEPMTFVFFLHSSKYIRCNNSPYIPPFHHCLQLSAVYARSISQGLLVPNVLWNYLHIHKYKFTTISVSDTTYQD